MIDMVLSVPSPMHSPGLTGRRWPRATCKCLHTAQLGVLVTAIGMPGMLSDRELNALREAKGVDARLFLTQMIAHHEGAISVVQTEIEEGQSPPAVAMARSIITTQQQEIDTMKGVLASL